MDFDEAVIGSEERGGKLAVPFNAAENALFVSLILGSDVPNDVGYNLGSLILTYVTD